MMLVGRKAAGGTRPSPVFADEFRPKGRFRIQDCERGAGGLGGNAVPIVEQAIACKEGNLPLRERSLRLLNDASFQDWNLPIWHRLLPIAHW